MVGESGVPGEKLTNFITYHHMEYIFHGKCTQNRENYIMFIYVLLYVLKGDVNPEPAIVTNPVDNAESRHHNFGDHTILPTNTEESLAASLQSNENVSNGPVSHPVNEKKCETVDHNVLSNSKEFKFGMQESIGHSSTGVPTFNMSSRGFIVNAEHSDLTAAKEQSTRAEKVC